MPLRLRAVKLMKNWALISHLWNSSLACGRAQASQPNASRSSSHLIAPLIASATAEAWKASVRGITVVERLLAALAADVDQGRIADGKLLTLVLALRLRRPDLFVQVIFSRSGMSPACARAGANKSCRVRHQSTRPRSRAAIPAAKSPP